MEKDFDELTIADDIAKQCTSMYILGLRVCAANSYVFCQAEKRNFLGFLCLAAPVPVIPCFTRLVYPACKSGKGSS